MILNATQRLGSLPKFPWIVWLHGFLGSEKEWMPVADALKDFSHLFIDLPGHGASDTVSVADFAQTTTLLENTLAHYCIERYWLVGYSLGGRIAMHYVCEKQRPGLCGLVVEGSHPGLSDEQERIARIASDNHWAERFRNAPIERVLENWYQQPIFASLTKSQRSALIALRRYNNPQALAAMLEATSLGKQNDLRKVLGELACPFIYFCGEQDMKFRAVAETLSVPCRLIAGAGHNAHREAPQTFARSLSPFLHQPDLRKHHAPSR